MAISTISLFAGGGGLDIGLARVGMRTVCFVERGAYAASVLVARMEDASLHPAPIWDDVTTFDGKPWRGRVDCVAGGFPCQDISLAGKGAGLDGERSGLWREYARIVGEVRPRLVFIENVAALVKRGLDRVLRDLDALGFDAEWDVFTASEVGAPHRRARLFVLAYANVEREREPHDAPETIGGVRAREDAGGGRAALAYSVGGGGGEQSRGIGGSGREDSAEPAQHREAVADADRDRARGPRHGGTVGVPSPLTRADRDGHALADADCSGFEGERGARLSDNRNAETGNHAHRCHVPFPPTRDDADGWRRYLEEHPGLEPAVRRGSDGLAYRMDRLRVLGNGVVPDQAEHAFRTLAARAGLCVD